MGKLQKGHLSFFSLILHGTLPQLADVCQAQVQGMQASEFIASQTEDELEGSGR